MIFLSYSIQIIREKDSILLNNSAYSWAKWLVKNDLVGYLVHGDRLELKALDIINKYDNIAVGIAPCHWVSKILIGLGLK